MGYCTLAEVKDDLGIDDPNADGRLTRCIAAASEAIDEYCHRSFDRVAGTRYQTAEYTDLLFLDDDLVSVTTLKTDENGDRVYERSWQATDYDLLPFNAAAKGKPYTRIEITPNGSYSFPTTRKGVEIVGEWGYPAVPDTVKEFCVLYTIRLFRRSDAPFGVIGSEQFGAVRISRDDPDAVRLLGPHVKHEVGAV